MTIFRYTKRNGEVVTRTSDADYTHASENSKGEVRFHKSPEAARRCAGRFGRVHTLSAERSCIVCEGKGWFVTGPDAMSGEYTTHTCHRCGGSGQAPTN